MTATERFVALLVGLVAILGGIGGMLKLLAVISWRLGQVIAQFSAHVTSDEKIHADIEARVRLLERPPRKRLTRS